MTKTNETFFTLLLIITGFFTSIFYVCPIVKSMWNMLVFPSANIHLTTGIILFCLLIKNIAIYKRSKTKTEFIDNLSDFVSMQLTIGMLWVFAKLYTYFI